MGERYWISGVQLGLLYGDIEAIRQSKGPPIAWLTKLTNLVREIEVNQYIRRIEEGQTKEVQIVDKTPLKP